MPESQQHLATLRELNRNFVRAVDEADVAWFDANLASDFCNTNPDGSFLARAAFLEQIGRGSSVKDIREHDVKIRLLGDYAVIHARTSYRKPDGSAVPGIVIPFSTTIQHGKNFFGLPFAAGDHNFSPSNFATKIFAVGLVFDGYVGMDPLRAGTPNAGGPNAAAANACRSRCPKCSTLNPIELPCFAAT